MMGLRVGLLREFDVYGCTQEVGPRYPRLHSDREAHSLDEYPRQ